MILYDKKGNFLGMSQKELSSLGFQDLDEFKSYHTDIADMFVNRPGYISNFKNFSWIDYALHSGAPNKNILIKNKNGNEMEAILHISEVFLVDTLNNESGIYNIEIDFNSDVNKINANPIFSSEPESDDTVDTSEIENETDTSYSTVDEDNTEKSEEPENNDFIAEDFDTSSYENINNKESSLDYTTDTDIPIAEYEPNIKLKIDFDSDDFESDEDTNTNKIQVDLEDEFDNAINIKDDPALDEELKTYTEPEPISNNQIEEEMNFEPIISIKQEPEEIDITQIAEDTGVGLEDLAQFINEFIDESKSAINLIKSSQETQNLEFIKNKLVMLKGIVAPLKIYSIVNTLDLVISSIGHDDFNNKLDIFATQVKNLEENLF
ncbi:MAG: hypothetical protein R3331_07590 [Sulfurospirillaceae bacterium]|nr:hypothetical protein [Sulfurospirillaceae bacterium]